MIYTKDHIVSFIIVILHLVGAIGCAIPQTRELTISLTPVNLLVNAGLLAYCHNGTKKQLILFFVLSSIAGFTVEVIGVTTGFPFGDYTYGSTLGLKLLNVPILIGVNWFILSYCFGMLTARLGLPIVAKSIVGALGMVLIDLLIEPIAVRFDYWTWHQGDIPLSNYAGWLVVSFGIQLVFHQLFKENLNKQSGVTVGCQAFYFSFLQIFFKI